MADIITNPVLSVCATVSSKIKDLVIKNGQLIFVQDSNKIAFDFGGKRKFYNSIETLDTDYDRTTLSPVNGQYYFVIETAVLWTYEDKWIPLTTPPDEIIFIGTELPELGKEKTLYVNKKKGGISIWDDETEAYQVVADKNEYVIESDIDSLF